MTTISLAAAKAHLSDVVSRVSKQHERVTVTVHGQPSAVLLSPHDLATLEETIAVLGDRDLMRQLAEAEGDLASDRVETRKELEAAMRSRRDSA
ncbi:type II toxin-antitoxin system Phd/YefM family antitoxin [Fodinibacter luteus]|uniref:Antitoxin n=1 Tax=Fodinibacter luteus TaxID=552064 RepID=A0ABP8KJ96_9MICO